jgi:hypothetical protein
MTAHDNASRYPWAAGATNMVLTCRSTPYLLYRPAEAFSPGGADNINSRGRLTCIFDLKGEHTGR